MRKLVLIMGGIVVCSIAYANVALLVIIAPVVGMFCKAFRAVGN